MNNLDLLRAFAVLCVFTSHLVDAMGFPKIGSLGRFGVVLFFVHTSLVLMGSLDRLHASGMRGFGRLSCAFYIRRLFRIYPAAMLTVLCIPLFHIPADPMQAYQAADARTLLSNLALVQPLTKSGDMLGPLWSLPLEVEMYILLPLAWLAIHTWKSRFAAYSLWLFALAAAWNMRRMSLAFEVFRFAPCFASGIVAYALMRNPGRRLPAWAFPLLLALIVAAFGPFDDIAFAAKLPVALILSLALGIAIARTQDGNWRFVNPVARWIAERSYGIYLFHPIALWIAFNLLRASPPVTQFAVLAAGVTLAPALIYRCVERPLMAWGGRVASAAVSQDRLTVGTTA